MLNKSKLHLSYLSRMMRFFWYPDVFHKTAPHLSKIRKKNVPLRLNKLYGRSFIIHITEGKWSQLKKKKKIRNQDKHLPLLRINLFPCINTHGKLINLPDVKNHDLSLLDGFVNKCNYPIILCTHRFNENEENRMKMFDKQAFNRRTSEINKSNISS